MQTADKMAHLGLSLSILRELQQLIDKIVANKLLILSDHHPKKELYIYCKDSRAIRPGFELLCKPTNPLDQKHKGLLPNGATRKHSAQVASLLQGITRGQLEVSS